MSTKYFLFYFFLLSFYHSLSCIKCYINVTYLSADLYANSNATQIIRVTNLFPVAVEVDINVQKGIFTPLRNRQVPAYSSSTVFPTSYNSSSFSFNNSTSLFSSNERAYPDSLHSTTFLPPSSSSSPSLVQQEKTETNEKQNNRGGGTTTKKEKEAEKKTNEIVDSTEMEVISNSFSAFARIYEEKSPLLLVDTLLHQPTKRLIVKLKPSTARYNAIEKMMQKFRTEQYEEQLQRLHEEVTIPNAMDNAFLLHNKQQQKVVSPPHSSLSTHVNNTEYIQKYIDNILALSKEKTKRVNSLSFLSEIDMLIFGLEDDAKYKDIGDLVWGMSGSDDYEFIEHDQIVAAIDSPRRNNYYYNNNNNNNNGVYRNSNERHKVQDKLPPDDPHFNKLWGLSNHIQPGADIHALQAWQIYTGKNSNKNNGYENDYTETQMDEDEGNNNNQNKRYYEYAGGEEGGGGGGGGIKKKQKTIRRNVVAVLDTGVDYNHPDLKDNMWVNEQELHGIPGVDDDGNGYIDDIYGYDFAENDGDPMDYSKESHGTHCSGIIAAKANNQIGITGIHWGAKIMALKFMREDKLGFISDAARALDYAINNGASITNNSWGSTRYPSKAIQIAIEKSVKKDMLFIVASGNDGEDIDKIPSFPATYTNENVVSVGAIDPYGQLAAFSNYGVNTVHVAAPGVHIYSTLPGGTYGSADGTSMASPYVAGVASLLWSFKPTLKFYEIKQAIFLSSNKHPSLYRKIMYGVVDAHAALQMLMMGGWIKFSPPAEIKPRSYFDVPITLLAEKPGSYTTAMTITLSNLGVLLERNKVAIKIDSHPRSSIHIGEDAYAQNTHNEENTYIINGLVGVPTRLKKLPIKNSSERNVNVYIVGFQGRGKHMTMSHPEPAQAFTLNAGKTAYIKVGCIGSEGGEWASTLVLQTDHISPPARHSVRFLCKIFDLHVKPNKIDLTLARHSNASAAIQLTRGRYFPSGAKFTYAFTFKSLQSANTIKKKDVMQTNYFNNNNTYRSNRLNNNNYYYGYYTPHYTSNTYSYSNAANNFMQNAHMLAGTQSISSLPSGIFAPDNVDDDNNNKNNYNKKIIYKYVTTEKKEKKIHLEKDDEKTNNVKYIWEDISKTGGRELHKLKGKNNAVEKVNTLFTFDFWGEKSNEINNENSIFICSNGFLSFLPLSNFDTSEAPMLLFDKMIRKAIIAPLWVHGEGTESKNRGSVYVKQTKELTKIQWQNILFDNQIKNEEKNVNRTDDFSYSFQVIIHINGYIDFYYQNISLPSALLEKTTIGVSDRGGRNRLFLPLEEKIFLISNTECAIRFIPIAQEEKKSNKHVQNDKKNMFNERAYNFALDDQIVTTMGTYNSNYYNAYNNPSVTDTSTLSEKNTQDTPHYSNDIQSTEWLAFSNYVEREIRTNNNEKIVTIEYIIDSSLLKLTDDDHTAQTNMQGYVNLSVQIVNEYNDNIECIIPVNVAIVDTPLRNSLSSIFSPYYNSASNVNGRGGGGGERRRGIGNSDLSNSFTVRNNNNNDNNYTNNLNNNNGNNTYSSYNSAYSNPYAINTYSLLDKNTQNLNDSHNDNIHNDATHNAMRSNTQNDDNYNTLMNGRGGGFNARNGYLNNFNNMYNNNNNNMNARNYMNNMNSNNNRVGYNNFNNNLGGINNNINRNYMNRLEERRAYSNPLLDYPGIMNAFNSYQHNLPHPLSLPPLSPFSLTPPSAPLQPSQINPKQEVLEENSPINNNHNEDILEGENAIPPSLLNPFPPPLPHLPPQESPPVGPFPPFTPQDTSMAFFGFLRGFANKNRMAFIGKMNGIRNVEYCAATCLQSNACVSFNFYLYRRQCEFFAQPATLPPQRAFAAPNNAVEYFEKIRQP